MILWFFVFFCFYMYLRVSLLDYDALLQSKLRRGKAEGTTYNHTDADPIMSNGTTYYRCYPVA